jgi:short-subunit dehydrogenase
VKECGPSCNINGVSVDANDKGAVMDYIKGMGYVDYIFINHAMFPDGDFVSGDLEANLAALTESFDVNIVSYARIASASLSQVRTGGHISVTSSLLGVVPMPGRASYASTKHAMNGFFDSFRMDLQNAKLDVTVGVSIIGNIAVEERVREIKDIAEIFTSQDAAHAIINGAVQRLDYVAFPRKQVHLATGMWRVAPKIFENVMRKIKNMHPCSTYPDILKPIMCNVME